MASPAPSALSRYRPSVIATATLAAAGSIYLVYTVVNRARELPPNPTPLRRRNAIRRSYQSSRPVDVENVDRLIEHAEQAINNATEETNGAHTPVDGSPREIVEPPNEAPAPNDVETEQSVDEPAPTREGSRLQELVYAIAKNNSEKEGIVHRGVTCDKCNRVPIVGVRYHCANCPDYDLCEDCEATECHLKTHVFYKVKVPSPWGGKKPLPLWYPGDPTALPSEIEDKKYRNRLSKETGFPLSKIDGLYQQFSCMANVQVTHLPQTSISMGIDRAAFDHCFIGQTMTDRPPVPNLIHDRLFAFYDKNQDGVVDFSEFVDGTSLVHNKNKRAREVRVFRGLDLNDDGFVSRKDCLKIFRAYYELNKDIMLGYLGIEREGENADLVLADREPGRHILTGRSLASYFSDGAPGGYYMNEPGRGKSLNEFNENVPSGADVEPIDSDAVADKHDSMTKDEVAAADWYNLHTVFNEDVFRLCKGLSVNWLPEKALRTFARYSTRGNHRNFIEHNNQLWVADATYFEKCAYIKVEAGDIPESYRMVYRAKFSDPSFYQEVHSVAKLRLCNLIRETMKTYGSSILEERKVSSQFYLEEEAPQNTKESIQDSTESKRTDRPAEDHLLNIDISTPEPDDSASVGDDMPFVGGTAAAHTIYNVVEDALNELLDPLFQSVERVAIGVQKTKVRRGRHSNQISEYLMHEERLLRAKWNIPLPDSVPEETHTYWDFLLVNPRKPGLVRHDANFELLNSAYMAFSKSVDLNNIREEERHELFLYWILQNEEEIVAEYRTAWDCPGNTGESTPADPTMPQNRPTMAQTPISKPLDDYSMESIAQSLPVKPVEVGRLNQARLLEWTRFEAVERFQRMTKRPAPGLLDWSEFARKLERTDENGDTLLQWVGGWVDLVMF